MKNIREPLQDLATIAENGLAKFHDFFNYVPARPASVQRFLEDPCYRAI